jgi:hypothetical protein
LVQTDVFEESDAACRCLGKREEVEKDLQVLGVRRWRELATDRKKWQDIVRQAKAHSGL